MLFVLQLSGPSASCMYLEQLFCPRKCSLTLLPPMHTVRFTATSLQKFRAAAAYSPAAGSSCAMRWKPMYLGTCVLACFPLRKVVLYVPSPCMPFTITSWLYFLAASRYRLSPKMTYASARVSFIPPCSELSTLCISSWLRLPTTATAQSQMRRKHSCAVLLPVYNHASRSPASTLCSQ